MKQLYLTWQDPKNRKWLPVGRLTVDNDVYRFEYTEGAKKSNRFIPFGRMTNLDAVYESTELFPLFANRLLPESRPEYKDYLKWLNLEEDEAKTKPFVVLAITGGIRRTDTLEMFPCPEPNKEGNYEVTFFSHGVRYLPQSTIERLNTLSTGDRLFLMHDLQNEYDTAAIALRTDDPKTIVGYCPRYLNDDFHQLLKKCGEEEIRVSVEKVNPEAPSRLRLLCRFAAKWPAGFEPCTGELYCSLAEASEKRSKS